MELSNYIVRTNNLTKVYRKQKVVSNVNMHVKKGAIYGFIGLNGAGKSTCIRLIAGLTEPTDGSIELFSATSKGQVHQARKRMGTMIEQPALFPNMTAIQNLEVIRLQRGIPGKECIQTTLEKVGLPNTGKKKVRTFSMGMKQRLGIAISLLSNPELLILDEPINGLDPIGVIEIRHLLQQLNEEYGVTIIISSHILTEVHQIATHYGIIHNGKLIKQSTAAEIEDACRAHLFLRVDDVTKAVLVIENELGTHNFEVLEDNSIKLAAYVNDPAKVSRILREHHIQIEQLTPKHDTLEEYFTKLIREESA